jgi:hypothetical protein
MGTLLLKHAEGALAPGIGFSTTYKAAVGVANDAPVVTTKRRYRVALVNRARVRKQLMEYLEKGIGCQPQLVTLLLPARGGGEEGHGRAAALH